LKSILEDIIKKRGIAYDELARKAKISRGTLWRIREGKTCRLKSAKKIAEALRLNIDDIFVSQGTNYSLRMAEIPSLSIEKEGGFLIENKRDTYRTITFYATQLIGAGKALITKYSEEQGGRGIPPGYGMTDEEIRNYIFLPEDIKYIGEHFPETSDKWFKGEIQFINKKILPKRIERIYRKYDIFNGIVLPIIYQKKRQGSLLIFNKIGGFSKQDIILGESIATLGSVIINNLHLIEESQIFIEDLLNANENIMSILKGLSLYKR